MIGLLGTAWFSSSSRSCAGRAGGVSLRIGSDTAPAPVTIVSCLHRCSRRMSGGDVVHARLERVGLFMFQNDKRGVTERRFRHAVANQFRLNRQVYMLRTFEAPALATEIEAGRSQVIDDRPVRPLAQFSGGPSRDLASTPTTGLPGRIKLVARNHATRPKSAWGVLVPSPCRQSKCPRPCRFQSR
jgi:hypothetical protein